MKNSRHSNFRFFVHIFLVISIIGTSFGNLVLGVEASFQTSNLLESSPSSIVAEDSYSPVRLHDWNEITSLGSSAQTIKATLMTAQSKFSDWLKDIGIVLNTDRDQVDLFDLQSDIYNVYLPLVMKNTGDPIVYGADLEINKTGDPLSVTPGGSIVYALDYANLSSQVANGVKIIENLPENTYFDSQNSTEGWQQIGETLQYQLEIGSLEGNTGNTATFAVMVITEIPPETTEIINNVSINHDGSLGIDPDLSNNSASDSTPVIPPLTPPDLVLGVSAGGLSVVPGAGLAYLVSYGNVSTQAASGTLISVALPENTIFDSQSSTTGWTFDELINEYVFSVGALASGASGQITFAVLVDDTIPSGIETIDASYEITDDGSSGIDPTPENNLAQVSTVLDAVPDLSITVSNENVYVQPGATLVFDINYSNVGNQDAEGVELTVNLPDNTTFDPDNSSPGWEIGTLQSVQYKKTVGILNALEHGLAKFAVLVDEDLPPGITQILLSAGIIDDGSNGEDPTDENNGSEEETPVSEAPDLTLTKTGPASIQAGTELLYTITYSNIGYSTSENVIITETVPEYSSFDAAASDPGWVRVGETDQYTFSAATLSKNESYDVTFAVTVDSDLPDEVVEITNTASITDDGVNGVDPDPTNNLADAITPLEFIPEPPDLSLFVSDGDVGVSPGGTLSYQIQYQNLGDLTATGLVLSATLPENTSFSVDDSTVGWVYNETKSVFELAITSLEPGTSGQAFFAVVVVTPAPSGLNSIEAQFEIFDDGSNGVDPDLTNNSVQKETPVNAVPDLTVNASSALSLASPGSVIIYDITYNNIGNQDASSVLLSATLPAQSSFNSAESSLGWVFDNINNSYEYSIGALNAEANGILKFAITLDEVAQPGVTSILTSFTISDDGANGVDPTPSNNLSQVSIPFSDAPDLSLTKTGVAVVSPGMAVQYTLTYSNTGFNTANNVIITETLPENTTFDAAMSDPGWAQIGATNQYTFSIGSLAKGSSGSATFAIVINSSIPEGTLGISNTASITDDGSQGVDPNPINNIANFESLFSTGPTFVCGAISEDTTWSPSESPYIATCDITINAGVTLTILPGTIVKFNATSRRLIVNGSLVAHGSANSRIQFTSYKDDSVGGDSNGDGSTTSPAPGDWSTILVNDTGTASFAYSDIRYGGYSTTYYSNVYLTQNAIVGIDQSNISDSYYYGVRLNNSTSGKTSRLSITNSIIKDNNNKGVYVYAVSGGLSLVNVNNCVIQNNGNSGFDTNNVLGLTFNNNVLNNNAGFAAYLNLGGNAAPDLTGNSGLGNSKNGIALVGPIAADSNLAYLSDLVYIIPSSGWTINSGVTMTLPAGQVVKVESTSGAISVSGTLIAQGSAETMISFTSLKDDSIGGDTNGDGESTVPAKGNWAGIWVQSGGTAVLEHTLIRYGGKSAYDALVRVVEGGSLTLTNSTLEHSELYGVWVDGVEAQAILNNTISDCSSAGIYVYDGSTTDGTPVSPEIRGNVISNCVRPILVVSMDGYTGEFRITDNSGSGNTYNYIQIPTRLVGNIKLGTSNAFDWVFTSTSISVTADATWELGPDEVIKMSSAGITVYGTLLTNTTADHPVVFTSLADNEYGYPIGSGTPARGNWAGIWVQSGGTAVLEHTLIRYGGKSAYDALVRVVEGGSLTLNNSTLEHSELYGVWVASAYHYISGNRFNDINSYAVYNGNTTEIRVRAENNWWGDASGPNPYGIGYGINYRMCQDPYTGNYYICEYYVDAVPWIGQDIGDSQDLIDKELPDDPFRNTAPKQPGIPYIESVSSEYGFFYFKDNSVDNIEIVIDWNGSDEGNGIPGSIIITGGDLSVEIEATDTIINYSINSSDFPIGKTSVRYTALADQQLIKSETFIKDITNVKLPEWLKAAIPLYDATYFIIETKPDYTEVKIEVKIPSVGQKYTLGDFGMFDNPLPKKVELPEFEIKGNVSLRSDGVGSASIKAHKGEKFGSIDGTDSRKLSVYLIVEGDGNINFSESYFDIEGDVGFGLGGELKYRFPLLSIICAAFGGSAGMEACLEAAKYPVAKNILETIYIGVSVKPEVLINLGYSASLSDAKIAWDSIAADGEIKARLGAGTSIITDGFFNMEFYGGITLEPEFCLTPELEWKQWSEQMLVGTKMTFLYMFEFPEEEYAWPKEIIKGPAYYTCGGTDSIDDLSQGKLPNSPIASLFETPILKVENPSYINEPYANFVGQQELDSTQRLIDQDLNTITDQPLMTNIYHQASPAIASNGEMEIVVWVHDDLELGNAQSKELVYSVKTNGSWSAPLQFTDNLMVDHTPNLAFIDDTHVLAVWQMINDPNIPDNSEYSPEIAKKIEIMYSFYDFGSDSWTSPEFLTNNNYMDARSKIAIGSDGTVMVFWIQNQHGDLLGSSESPSQIFSSTWNGSVWITSNLTEMNVIGLLSYTAAVDNINSASLVFSTDSLGLFTELSTLELFGTEWNGSSWGPLQRITQNDVIDDVPSLFYNANGDRWLVWIHDKNMNMLKNSWDSGIISTESFNENTFIGNYKIANNNAGDIFAVWQSNSEEGSDLFISLFDSSTETWKLQDQLTSSLGIERQFDLSFTEEESIHLAYVYDNLLITDKVIDGVTYPDVVDYESTDLHVLHYTPDSDLTATNLHLPYRPNPEPGETILVRADISNVGDWSVENPSINFYDGDPTLGGVLIGTYAHVGYVAAGTSVTAEVNWTVPADSTTSHTIFALVDPDGLIDEKDETNNRTNLTTILPDLTVSSMSAYYYDQGKVIPVAVIYNSGKISAENVLVEFRDGAVDGPVVYSEIIPLIEKEGMVAVSTEINATSWIPGSYQYFVTVDSLDEINEVDEANNSDYFTIKVMPDLVIYAGDITATLEEGVGGSVYVTLRNWGIAPGENIIVSLYEGPDIDLTRTPLHTWTVPSLLIDGVTTLSTTIDHIPNHLFAVADPESLIEEVDESNNVAYESLPVVHGSYVTVPSSADPNLDDIIYVGSEFLDDTGVFSTTVQTNLYDVSSIMESPTLCDISTLETFTDLQGKIALIEKTTLCEPSVQVNNAGSLGAAAALIYNNLEGGNVREVMTGPAVSIPAGFLARQDGLDLLPFHEHQVIVASEYEAVTILDPY